MSHPMARMPPSGEIQYLPIGYQQGVFPHGCDPWIGIVERTDSPEDKTMKTLDQYEKDMKDAYNITGSNIECPRCGAELQWDGAATLVIHPTMRRVLCLKPECGFKRTVVV